MIKLNIWMLATVLFCGFTLTGCKDDDAEVSNSGNGGNGDDGTPSAVDKGTWTDLSQHMDPSVNSGDDFFMYCNGKWWKNTTVSPVDGITGYGSDLAKAFNQKVSALDIPSLTKFMSDFKKKDQTAAQAQALYDKMLKDSGLETATTKEEAWKAAAKLAKAGASMMIRLYPFSKGGTLRLYAMIATPDYMGEVKEKEDAGNDTGGDDTSGDDDLGFRHGRRSPTNNPAFLSSLTPVGNATRSISNTEWPMVYTFVKELGLNPEEVYTISDYYTDRGDAANANVAILTQSLKEIQDMKTADFIKLAKSYLQADMAFVSSAGFAEVSKLLKTTPTDNAIEIFIEKNYLTYEMSKVVGDKLVTADDILHGEQAVKELMDAFKERIQKSDWLSAGSKQNAIEKLNNMGINVGRPDKWMTEALPDIQKCNNALEDMHAMRKARLNGVMALNGKLAKQYSFHALMMDVVPMGLDVANAFYESNYNCINLLPYYITAPWYSATQNQALNYEAYNTFGHEITHGFDTNGSQFDKNGDPKPLWATEADAAEFQKRANQLAVWYKTFDLLPNYSRKANGDVTISEDIADLGGMELAFQCYNKYLDDNGFKGDEKQLQLKRFFYAYSQEFRSKYTKEHVDLLVFGEIGGEKMKEPDVHSMDKERVNGIVSNCDGWYNTFGITSGKLYRAPSERVHIW